MLIEASPIPIAGWDGDVGILPEFLKDRISFNGVGEDAHETFVLTPKETGFTFCKTARKPYDTLVVAILCLADLTFPGLLSISSDGDSGDWEEGLLLARLVNPGAVIPAEVEAY